MKTLRTEKTRVQGLSATHYFNSSWQSVDRIPIVLSLLKEELNRLETANSTDWFSHETDLPKKLSSYQTLYRYWSQIHLNPRQTEWISKMQLYLQALQQKVSSLSSALNHFSVITQKKSGSVPDYPVTNTQEAGG